MTRKAAIFAILAATLPAASYPAAGKATPSPSPTATISTKASKDKHKPAKETPKPTASPTTVPSTDKKSEKNPRWVAAPPITNESRWMKFSVNTIYSESLFGYIGQTVFDMHARRRLDEYSVTAEGFIRVKKTFSNSDNLNEIEVRSARATYLENWLQLSVGRLDISEALSGMHFFGNYPVMGIRRADGLMAVLPIRFSFGVEDYKNVSSPPTALSLFYFPSLFSAQMANLDRSQALFLGQLRMKMKIAGIYSTFRANIGGTKSSYFEYSSLNGKLTYSGAVDFNMAKDYILYTEYGVQSSVKASETGALAFGLKANRIKTFGPISLDEILVEYQKPMAKDSSNNPFIGGNEIYPDLADPPQNSWYVSVKMRAKAIILAVYATNSKGDFTFQRVSPLAVNSYNVPFPLGPSNETDDLGLPLISKAYTNRAVMGRVGVEF